MSDEAEFSISELRRKRAQATGGSQSSGATPPPSGQSAQPSQPAQPPHSAQPVPHSPSPREPVRPAVEPVIIETPPRPAPMPILTMAQPVYAQPTQPAYATAPAEENKPLPFDPWRIPAAIKRRWYWLVLAGLAFAILGTAAGVYRAKCFTRLTFTLRDLSNRSAPSTLEGDPYKPRQIALQTMVNFLTSGPLLQRVSLLSTNPPMTARQLLSALTVVRERDSENIAVTISLRKSPDVVQLANLYSANAVLVSRELMSRDPLEYITLQSNNLAEIRVRLAQIDTQMTTFLASNNISFRPELQRDAYAKELSEDMKKLEDLRIDLYQLDHFGTNTPGISPDVTDAEESYKRAREKLRALQDKGLQPEHPDVKIAIATVNNRKLALEAAQKAAANNSTAGPDAEVKLRKANLERQIKLYEARVESDKKSVEAISPLIANYTAIDASKTAYEKAQRNSLNRLSEAQQYLKGAEGFYDPPSYVTYKDVDTRTRYKTMAMYGILGGFAGVALSIMLVLFLEITDSRLKTAADVKRVTELPVLASLGDLNKMDDEARKAWAFRTWTILSGTLSKSANRGTVCGIISCSHGEGRSTWVELLVDAARQRGFEVTKLDFGKADDRARYESGEAEQSADKESSKAKPSNPESDTTNFASAAPGASPSVPIPSTVQKVMQAKAASVIHVQLPGLVWNLERRIQFHEELEKWQSVSSAVILIDLPPACVPEAVLLAENLPQVLWLVDSGKSRAGETQMHLETLRHARCKLVGAVLNHEPVSLIKL